MSEDLFQEGGPLNAKRVGPDEYRMSITIPTDQDGFLGRECPNPLCSPAYFKVKPGTGLHDQVAAYCPYCRTSAEPPEFTTKAQRYYAEGLVENEAIGGIHRMLKQALGLDPSGKKTMDGGLFSLEVSLKPAPSNPIPRLVEEELRRDVTCPKCTLEQAVFGLATWCADCGEDVFLVHIEGELKVIKRMLAAVDERGIQLGQRVAARDVENALEDLVSLFEASLKAITVRHLLAIGNDTVRVAEVMEKNVRNQYQNIGTAALAFRKHLDIDLLDGIPQADLEFLRLTFEKRHPITHNLGVVDRKYMERVRSGELRGREIRVSAGEVGTASDLTLALIANAHRQAFPPLGTAASA